MTWMNDYDLDEAERRYDPGQTPNRAHLTATVSALRDWTNRNSDGWPYWSKPSRAAARAMGLIEATTWEETERRATEDATDAETKAALSPIKAFLTRQGVAHDTVIPARQTGIRWTR
jgi:hypothetical protein